MKRWLLLTGCMLAASCSSAASNTSSGRVIEVFGPYRGVEADDFAASLTEFENDTGITVRYTGSADFVKDLRERVEGGLSAPDIAIVPQPGLVDEMLADDRLVAFDDASVAALTDNYPADLTGTAVKDAEIYSAPSRETIKSLVWYRPSVFEANGWTVPTTLDELTALVDRIQETGDADGPMAPWCFAMQSGSATGWTATDWVEDLVLRQAGVDVYDEWASGKRGFDDPAIRSALTTFNDLVIAPGRTAGGLRNILQTDVTLASAPLFGDQPGCAMYKQASFAESWFPDETVVGEDVDFFVLPGVTDSSLPPLVAGGDSLVQFSDDPDVHRLMTYLISPDGAREWAARGGYYSARTSVDLDTYYTPADRAFAELFRDGRDYRFDASDVMPPAIGSDLFWKEITSWISGATTLDQFVATMDAAYADAPTG